MRPILLTGGAPRLPVDAVRHLMAGATGTTALVLARHLADPEALAKAPGNRTKTGRFLVNPAKPAKPVVDLLLGSQCEAVPGTLRFDTREDLDNAIKAWVKAHPEGVVVMAAAVNDYTPYKVEVKIGDTVRPVPFGHKVPSKTEELVIRCRPAPKLIDQLRQWGLSGPLVGFKHEATDTVVAAAQSLRLRVAASLVVANSLDGSLLALVDAVRVQPFENRDDLLVALAQRILSLAA